MESARKILQIVKPGIVVDFSQGGEKEISLDRLVNKLNFINFTEDSILVNFKHPKYTRTVSLDATPLPCLNNRLECRWTKTKEIQPNLQDWVFEDIFIIDGQKLIVAVPELITLSEEGAIFLLTEKCFEIDYRKLRRHPCEGIQAELLQNSARFQGTLVDFSAASFRIQTESSNQPFHRVKPEVPVLVIFSSGNETLFSGECRIVSQSLGQKSRVYLLESLLSRVQRFNDKEIRSIRHELLPRPNVVFKHPLTGRIINLEVIDLSGSGFAVQEEQELSMLLPGMVIPNLELRIPSGLTTSCSAQVIYRVVTRHEDGFGSGTVRCGLCFLDMDIREHVNLLSLLYPAKNKNAYFSYVVQTEELWRFFFETGFIPPEKYTFVEANKGTLKERYERLYTQNPGIARHFTYHENGAILGHMALLRFYQNSWLIQHYSAANSTSTDAGLVVLNQLAHSINDSHNLHSAHMSYVFCYYRADNEFHERVLGSATRIINDNKGCSLDTFACLNYQRTFSDDWNFSGPWELTPSTEEDLFDLESFYEQESGGLMLNALNLEPEMTECDELSEEYRRLGFTMKRNYYSIKKNGNIKAVAMVNVSDVGLNLSYLTTSIHITVIDQEQFSREIVYLMLSILAHRYDQNEIPVLIYPVSYAESANIPYDAKYALWALNIPQSGARFLKYLTELVTPGASDIQ